MSTVTVTLKLDTPKAATASAVPKMLAAVTAIAPIQYFARLMRPSSDVSR